MGFWREFLAIQEQEVTALLEKMKNKLLILGASGHIGRYFLSQPNIRDTVGTYHSHAFKNGIKFDMEKDTLAKAIPNLKSITHAILLLGITNIEWCAKNIKLSNRINISLMKKIVDSLVENNITIVFASTESIFDGTKGNWKESHIPHPTIQYAKQKYAIEQYLMRKSKKYIIARFGKVYGTIPDDGTLITTWVAQLLKGEQLMVAQDETFSPISTRDLVNSVLRLINGGAQGIYHIAGPQGFSRKELFEMTLHEIQKKKILHPHVLYCSIDDFNFIEKRPHNVSLSINKLVSKTGFVPQNPQTVIKEIVRRHPM